MRSHETNSVTTRKALQADRLHRDAFLEFMKPWDRTDDSENVAVWPSSGAHVTRNQVGFSRSPTVKH